MSTFTKVCNKISLFTKNSETKHNFIPPPWNKELLKLEFKISVSSQNMHFSHFSSRGRLFVVNLFLIFEDFLRSVRWCWKNKEHIWKEVCSDYCKKNLHLIDLTLKIQFKAFLWWYFSNYSRLLPKYVKVNCNLKNSNLQTVKTVFLTWLLIVKCLWCYLFSYVNHSKGDCS